MGDFVQGYENLEESQHVVEERGLSAWFKKRQTLRLKPDLTTC